MTDDVLDRVNERIEHLGDLDVSDLQYVQHHRAIRELKWVRNLLTDEDQ